MRGDDPEGTGLTAYEKVINYLSTGSINEPLPSNLEEARPPARYFSWSSVSKNVDVLSYPEPASELKRDLT
jgi:hypothetical protein